MLKQLAPDIFVDFSDEPDIQKVEEIHQHCIVPQSFQLFLDSFGRYIMSFASVDVDTQNIQLSTPHEKSLMFCVVVIVLKLFLKLIGLAFSLIDIKAVLLHLKQLLVD